MRTLRQLAERLNNIIAENDARGWSERNDLPAAVEVITFTPTGKVRQKYYEVNYVSSAQHGIREKQYCGVINVDEKHEIK